MKLNIPSVMILFVVPAAMAWAPTTRQQQSTTTATTTNTEKNNFRLKPLGSAPSMSIGSLHGQNSCFLPLKQLDQDYCAPRIVQVCYTIFVVVERTTVQIMFLI